VGTWYLRSECVPNAKSWFCPSYTIFIDVPEPTISYTFNRDGTIVVTTSGGMTLTEPYPIACIGSDAGPSEACSGLEQSVQQWLPGAQDAGTSSWTLTDFACSVESDQVCTCVGKYNLSQAVAAGTYATSGNQLISTAGNPDPMSTGGSGDAGTGRAMDYCVSGNTLKLGWTYSASNYVATLTR
jgi:hypothetical protein